MTETWYELNTHTYTITPVAVVGETKQTIHLVQTFVSGPSRVIRTYKKTTYAEYYPTRDEAFEALRNLLQKRYGYYKDKLEEVEKAQIRMEEEWKSQ